MHSLKAAKGPRPDRWAMTMTRIKRFSLGGYYGGYGEKIAKLSNDFKGEWRRDRDSNPGSAQTDNGFRDRRIRPLCHLSAVGIVAGIYPGLKGLASPIPRKLGPGGRSGFGKGLSGTDPIGACRCCSLQKPSGDVAVKIGAEAGVLLGLSVCGATQLSAQAATPHGETPKVVMSPKLVVELSSALKMREVMQVPREEGMASCAEWASDLPPCHGYRAPSSRAYCV